MISMVFSQDMGLSGITMASTKRNRHHSFWHHSSQHHSSQQIVSLKEELNRSWSGIEVALKFATELGWARVADSASSIADAKAF